MNIQDSNQRGEILNALEERVNEFTPVFSHFLKDKLNSEEEILYRKAQEFEFKKGSWYRYHHNFIVTAAMKTISQKEDIDPSILMPAAILHDIGYSGIEVGYRGGDWEGEDKRIGHMELGVKMASDVLDGLAKEEKIKLGKDQKEEILDIIGQHDNCYVSDRKEDYSENGLIHLDADRIYVMAFSSFYKDLMNYLDKGKVNDADSFLSTKLASFYDSNSNNPISSDYLIDESKLKPQDGPNRRPLILKTSREISDKQFIQRRDELKSGILEGSLSDFKRMCDDRLFNEAHYFLNKIKRN